MSLNSVWDCNIKIKLDEKWTIRSKVFWLKWKLGHIIRISVCTQIDVDYAEYIDKVVLVNFECNEIKFFKTV